jgi:hypothetical protein
MHLDPGIPAAITAIALMLRELIRALRETRRTGALSKKLGFYAADL